MKILLFVAAGILAAQPSIRLEPAVITACQNGLGEVTPQKLLLRSGIDWLRKSWPMWRDISYAHGSPRNQGFYAQPVPARQIVGPLLALRATRSGIPVRVSRGCYTSDGPE